MGIISILFKEKLRGVFHTDKSDIRGPDSRIVLMNNLQKLPVYFNKNPTHLALTPTTVTFISF